MEIHTIGIDPVFHFVGLNARGEVVVQRKCSRSQLLRFTSNLRVCLIGMEACGGAHFLGRALRNQGHDVRLMPAQYVKPYVKTNKNDYIDAEAIAEAVGRPRMRFAPIKTDDQLDLQSLHRIRERWIVRRTAVINQIRGLLLERGITIRKGRVYRGKDERDEVAIRTLAGFAFSLDPHRRGTGANRNRLLATKSRRAAYPGSFPGRRSTQSRFPFSGTSESTSGLPVFLTRAIDQRARFRSPTEPLRDYCRPTLRGRLTADRWCRYLVMFE